MGHDHHRGVEAAHEAFEPFETVDVEVVGGLVQQEHVEAGEEQRGQLGPGGLAAGQPAQLAVEGARRQAEVVGDGRGAGVEVGVAERHPPVERAVVALWGAGIVGGEGCGRLVELRGRGRHLRAPRQQGAHGLARPGLGLLGQVADGGGGGRQADLPAIGLASPGEDPQQRRLAGPVGADETQAGTGGQHEVDAGEQQAGPGGDGEVAGGQRGEGRGHGAPRSDGGRTLGSGRVRYIAAEDRPGRRPWPNRFHGPWYAARSAVGACGAN